MRFACLFILIISILPQGYAGLSEQAKSEAKEILDQLILFDKKEGLDYRQSLIESTPDSDKRNWKKAIVPWTTLDWDMEPDGNNLYLLILQMNYFDAKDKTVFLDTIEHNIITLYQLELFLKQLERDEWLFQAIVRVQKTQNYWIYFKENLLKYKQKDNRLLYSVRFQIADECTRLFKLQFLDEREFSSWICDNIKLQRTYRKDFNLAHPNKMHEEEAKTLSDTEDWLMAWINGKNPSVRDNKSLQDSLKLIYQKFHAFYFKNHAANDWWMLVAFYNDAVAKTTSDKDIGRLGYLIQKLENTACLTDDEVAYYLMAICSEFTISYAKRLGMDLVNLEHRSVIKKAEQRRILPSEKLDVWRRMNYDRNQIAHGYDQSFNHGLREKITEYITLIKENKL